MFPVQRFDTARAIPGCVALAGISLHVEMSLQDIIKPDRASDQLEQKGGLLDQRGGLSLLGNVICDYPRSWMRQMRDNPLPSSSAASVARLQKKCSAT